MSTGSQSSIYERPAAEILFDDENNASVVIRASQATACQRQLYYAVTGEEQTNEVPPEAKARMEMGKALEPVVMDLLRDKGWDVQAPIIDEDNPEDSIHFVYLAGDPEVYLSGIPDCIATTQEDEVHGEGAFAVEIKTRGTGPFRFVKMQGNWKTQFGAVVQLAMYRQALIEEDELSADVDCCIVTMNKDDGELDIEWFRPSVMDEAMVVIGNMLHGKVESWLGEEIPEPEHEPGSWQCNSCQWLDVCGNNAELKIDLSGEKISEEEAITALRDWEEVKLAEVPLDKDAVVYPRAVMLRYMQGLGVDKVTLQGRTRNWNISARQKDSISLNDHLVRYYLTPEQYDECLEINAGEPYTEIRKGKAL